jgi:hypothetical protein
MPHGAEDEAVLGSRFPLSLVEPLVYRLDDLLQVEPFSIWWVGANLISAYTTLSAARSSMCSIAIRSGRPGLHHGEGNSEASR